jgi:hypothetical protein
MKNLTPTDNLTSRLVSSITEDKPFTLDDYEDVQTAEIELKHPISGGQTGMIFEIAGPEHPARKRLVQARQRRMRNELQKSGQIKLNDPTEDDQDELELLIACTLGWRNIITRDSTIEFTPENVVALYSDPKKHWVRTQIRAKLDEVELFIRRSEIV